MRLNGISGYRCQQKIDFSQVLRADTAESVSLSMDARPFTAVEPRDSLPHLSAWRDQGLIRVSTAALPQRTSGSLGIPSGFASASDAPIAAAALELDKESQFGWSKRPSTRSRVHTSHSLHSDGRRPSRGQKSAGANSAPSAGRSVQSMRSGAGFSQTARTLAGATAIKDFVRSPANQTDLMRDMVDDWMRYALAGRAPSRWRA
jgi:hypothetical protein